MKLSGDCEPSSEEPSSPSSSSVTHSFDGDGKSRSGDSDNFARFAGGDLSPVCESKSTATPSSGRSPLEDMEGTGGRPISSPELIDVNSRYWREIESLGFGRKSEMDGEREMYSSIERYLT